jgi:hypothetical protein
MLKGKSKKLRLSLAVVICLSLPVLSAYLHYNNLMEVDFLSSTLNFENADLEDALWVEQQDPFMVCGLDNLSTLFFSDKNFHPLHLVSFQKSSSFQKTFVLRC